MAKKDVGGIVAGAGLLASIFTEFVQAVYDRGGTAEDIHRLATPEGRTIIGQWADLTVHNTTSGSTFDLSVDYSRPLAEVVAAGNYSHVNDNITEENFPTAKGDPEVVGNPTGVNVTQAVLVHLDRIVESDDVLAELEQRGLRPGTMFELAHFGEQHPEVQRQFPVVAIGSVWTDPDGNRSVGYRWEDADSRKLRLFWYDGGWGARCRFLTFRK